jgi:hypothetical protein
MGYIRQVMNDEKLELGDPIVSDPIVRIADDGVMADVEGTTPPDRLDDFELRDRLANLDTMLREAPDLGTEDHLVLRLKEEWTELRNEYDQRGLEPPLDPEWSANE